MRRNLLAAALITVTTASLAANAQAPDDFLERWAATRGFRLGRPTSITGTPDGNTILFLRSGPRSFVQDLWRFDVATGRERRWIDAETLLGGPETLGPEEKARRERMRVAARGIVAFHLSPDGKQVLVPMGGELFLVPLDGSAPRRLPGDGGPAIDPRFSPDGRSLACVRAGDLYIIDLTTGVERRLTAGATEDLTLGLAEFVAQEEMSRFQGYWWSPDSARILYQETDTSGVERMTIADPARPEQAPDRWPYPRPGKANARVRLGLLEVGGWATEWIDWSRNEYEYLAAVDWPEHGALTLTVQNRRQTELALLAVDPATREVTPLVVERDRAWVDIDETMPVWLPDGSGFLWTSEREGARRLELRSADGSLRHALTEPSLGMRRFERAEFAAGYAIVQASADPTESALWRVPLAAGGPPTRMTSESGMHSVASRGNGPLFVVAAAPLAGERSWQIWDARGPRERFLTSVSEPPGFEPNLEFVRVGTDPAFDAVVIRPRAFRADLRYPVIDHVYGGPTSQMVLRDPERYLLDQWIADQGFIVVSVDGRGTPGRGRDWNRAVRLDLISQPLDDHATAMRLLGQRFSEIDLTRVGIYGWSFGGYFSTMAVLRRPDAFHVAVAGAPVVSWLDYDTHYTERYMDLPEINPEGYRTTDALTWVDRLQRPLLLIHGTADDNVYFTHSLKLADGLFRAGRRFEFLPLPGFTHMVPDPLVTRRLYDRILGLFRETLQGSAGRPARPEVPRPY